MSDFDFIRQLGESRLVPSTTALRRYDAAKVTELLHVYLCAVRIIMLEEETADWGRRYLRRTIQYGDFDRWRSNGTDLYVLLHAYVSDDAELKNQDGSDAFKARCAFDVKQVLRWFKSELQDVVSPPLVRRIFVRLDNDLRVHDSSLRAIRRLVMDWPDLTRHERELVMTRLLQVIRARAPKSELLPQINAIARQQGLELDDVCNLETGEGCEGGPGGGAGQSDRITPKKGSLLKHLAAATAGAVAGHYLAKKFSEDASAGATSAASIATVPGSIGAGFDAKGDRGIYQKSKIIRR